MPKITPPNKYKVIGQNYTTGDLHAKVTGKAKYAEDYRADGMLSVSYTHLTLPTKRIV